MISPRRPGEQSDLERACVLSHAHNRIDHSDSVDDMSVRNSSYARMDGDTYVTPSWVWQALYTIDDGFINAFDPAPSVRDNYDFFTDDMFYQAIATNPPFKLSTAFVVKAIHHTKPCFGKVAMLLPHSWDTAKKRTELFEVPFKGKYALTRRIRWENLEQKKNGPSTNHSWFIWDWKYQGKQPIMGWLK